MKLLSVIDTLGAGGKERRFTELMKALSHLTWIEIRLVVMSNTIHYTEINDLGIEIIKIIRKTRKIFQYSGSLKDSSNKSDLTWFIAGKA